MYLIMWCYVCVMQGFRTAGQLAAARLRELAVGIEGDDSKAARGVLEKCAKTSLNSKLISRYQVRAHASRLCLCLCLLYLPVGLSLAPDSLPYLQDFFAPMIVDAVLSLGEELDIDMVRGPK